MKKALGIKDREGEWDEKWGGKSGDKREK